MSVQFSIIVPTLNQSAKLWTCLRYLRVLKSDANTYEVIVVDNNSTDNTSSVCESFVKVLPNLRYVLCGAPGLMAARHKGFAESKGDFLCFIDDDTLVTPDWLVAIADAFSDPEVVLVGGPCIPRFESEPPRWLESFWSTNQFGRTNGYLSLVDFGTFKRETSPEYVFGCNYSIRKSVLASVGGTHPDYLPVEYKEYQGDGETGIAQEVAIKGKAVYHPGAGVEHLVPKDRMTIEYFCKRAYFNGIGYSYTISRKLLRPRRRYSFFCLCRSVFLTLVRQAKALSRVFLSVGSLRVRFMKLKIIQNWWAGFIFHQIRVLVNPKLRMWIAKDSYLSEGGDIDKFLEAQG